MGTITYTREAKCKDCEFIKYFYKGKRKYHKCIKKDMQIRLNDPSWCHLVLFEMRKGYHVEQLKLDQ